MSRSARNQRLRNRLRAKFGDLCHYCKCEMDFNKQKPTAQKDNAATIEHLIAAYDSEEYKKNPSLIVLACYKCNHGRALEFQNNPENKQTVLKLNAAALQKRIEKIKSRSGSCPKHYFSNLRNIKRKLSQTPENL